MQRKGKKAQRLIASLSPEAQSSTPYPTFEFMVAVKKDKISGDALGTGRRKSSVARVRVRAGSGKITVNSKPIAEYFVNDQHREAVASTLAAVEQAESVDVLGAGCRRRNDRSKWRRSHGPRSSFGQLQRITA